MTATRNDAQARAARQERAETRAAGSGPGQARVYVIVAPKLRQSNAWPRLRAVLRARAKNADLAVWEDVFADSADYDRNWTERLAGLSGALVVPTRKGGNLWLGFQAAREAAHVASLGKPVLVLMADGLLPWPAMTLERPDSYPHGLPFQVAPDQADTGSRGHPAGSPAGRTEA